MHRKTFVCIIGRWLVGFTLSHLPPVPFDRKLRELTDTGKGKKFQSLLRINPWFSRRLPVTQLTELFWLLYVFHTMIMYFVNCMSDSVNFKVTNFLLQKQVYGDEMYVLGACHQSRQLWFISCASTSIWQVLSFNVLL